MSAVQESPAPHVVPLHLVLSEFVPGSYPQPWSWDDEERSLHGWAQGPHAAAGGQYQRLLEEHLREQGSVQQPVFLGDDGRVWDGHHRIVAARRIGFAWIPAECFCDDAPPCAAAAFVPPLLWDGDQA